MNPETRQFHDLDADGNLDDGQPCPPDWPRFAIGEEVEVHGVAACAACASASSSTCCPS